MNDQPKKQQYWAYRILGIVDNFIAILFLFSVLVNFTAMGFHPALLLYVFISLSVLIYTNLTAVFARHVMVRGNALRMKLKEWIRVNAYVTIIFGALMSLMLVVALANKSFIQKISEGYNLPGNVLRNAIYILLICMILLSIHVIMTFRYVRRFADHFRDEVQS